MNRFWALYPLAALVLAAVSLPSSPGAEDEPICPNPLATKIFGEIKDTMGLPVSHKDDEDLSEVEKHCPKAKPNCNLVCRAHYCAYHNPATKLPDWVIERLTGTISERLFPRPKVKFKSDDKLPENMPSAGDADYTNSGLARGHQAASADFAFNRQCMRDTFFFTNAVPQVQDGFNGGIWRQLEDHVQELVLARGDLETYVITGPVEMAADGGETVISEGANGCGNRIVLAGLSKLKKREICDANDKDPSKSCENGVAVPAGLFKIVYLPESERAFGFLMSNEDHRNLKDSDQTPADYFEEWRATLSVIEEATSLKFFPNLSLRESNMRKTHCTETRWH